MMLRNQRKTGRTSSAAICQRELSASVSSGSSGAPSMVMSPGHTHQVTVAHPGGTFTTVKPMKAANRFDKGDYEDETIKH